MKYVVYWLFDKNCWSPEEDGYVGVSKHFVRRVHAHRRRRVHSNGRFFSSRILFEGTKQQCFDLEIRLRPAPGIGWNRAAGGEEGFKCGHCPETMKKFRAIARKRAQTEEGQRQLNDARTMLVVSDGFRRFQRAARDSRRNTGMNHTVRSREQIAESVRKSWALRRIKYGQSGGIDMGRVN